MIGLDTTDRVDWGMFLLNMKAKDPIRFLKPLYLTSRMLTWLVAFL